MSSSARDPDPVAAPEAAAFYQALVMQSTDLISVISEQGVYSFVGRSVKSQLGYEVEELVGQSAFSFIHPSDAPAAEEALAELPYISTAKLKPFRYRTKSGEWRWIECTLSNMLDNPAVRGIVTNSKDVTDMVEAERQNAYHLAYYRSLFLEHPEAVFSLNSDGYFQQVNRHVAEVTGYREEELLGVHYSMLVFPDCEEIAHEAFRQALAGQAQHTELPILTKEKQKKDLFLTMIPVHIGGMALGMQGIAQDITLARQAQKLLQEQAMQLNNIVESIPDPFFVLDDAWRYEYANTAYCRFIDRSWEELEAKNLLEVFPEMQQKEFFEKCKKVAQYKSVENFEESYGADYSLTLKYSIFPANNGIAVHFVDYTTQKVVQRELEKLSLVASKTINGIVIMDAQCRIEWVNDGFSRLTGYSREEALGHVPSSLLQGPETDPVASERIRKKYRALKPFSEEILNYRKTGEKFWFSIDVTPIFDAQGQLVNYIAIETDITEKKADEAKLTKLADDLMKHNRNLQQFAFMVSHNLRAPVANALGLTSLLQKIDRHSAAYGKTLEKLDTSVNQLDNVIRDISSILAVREAGGVIQREQVDLRELCQEVLQSFQEQLEEYEVQVRLEVESEARMLTIKAYLYSILYNLISNALKFRSPERPLVLDLKIARDKRGFRITFEDNGLGMDMHFTKNQLFKLYNRFHPHIQGKGIGLYMVKTQVETLGGKIKVSSSPGAGTTFTLLLGAKHV